ncbi:hypothetical protein L2638_19750 [Acinetobacter baumannii]|uniref:hypothetical protein n=1 Tax=Acinetobacter baumannii TaxID=470 RepID=UPI0021497597|nr:hypothetical protein [Acinetobacter baumannii]MCQ9994105.1 hypothetical protein [Acinetobacter baumannii]
MKAKLIVISLSLICSGPMFAGSNSMQDVFLKINSERETAHSLQKNRLIKVESGRFCNEHLCTRQISQNPYPIRILPS